MGSDVIPSRAGIAWLFPGQGSQFVGMGHDLLGQFPPARAALLRAGEMAGTDLLALVARGPDDALTRTDNLQPALTAMTVGCCLFLHQAGLRPDFVAGHSLGEYAALFAAGVISLDDALRLTVARGRIMQAVAETIDGGMLAVKDLPADRIEAVLTRLNQDVTVANHNAATQIAVCGPRKSLPAAAEALTAAGGQVVALNVSGPWHSPLLAPAADSFAAVLDETPFRDAVVPVAMNATGVLERSATAIRAAMIRQICSPVRWHAAMLALPRRRRPAALSNRARRRCCAVCCGTFRNWRTPRRPTSTARAPCGSSSALRTRIRRCGTMNTAWLFAGHGAQYPGMGRTILRRTEPGRHLAGGRRRPHPACRSVALRCRDPLGRSWILLCWSHCWPRSAVPTSICYWSGTRRPRRLRATAQDICPRCMPPASSTAIPVSGSPASAVPPLSVAASTVPGGMVAVHGLPERPAYLSGRKRSRWCRRHRGPKRSDACGLRRGPSRLVAGGQRGASRAGAVVSDLLDVAGPWHTPLLDPARITIETAIADLPFRPADRPVFSTVTGLATRDPEALRWALATSVACTVEWHATVQAMLTAGIDDFVEVSPGRSLWGLLGQQDNAFGVSRRYQECVRGPAQRSPRMGSATPRQLFPAQVPA